MNWMYKGTQDEIWNYVSNQLKHWRKDGYQDPITYFTDGLCRWIALEILKEKLETSHKAEVKSKERKQ